MKQITELALIVRLGARYRHSQSRERMERTADVYSKSMPVPSQTTWSLQEMIDGQVIFLCQIIQQIQACISWWEKFPDQNADVTDDEKICTSRLLPLIELVRLKEIYQDQDLEWRTRKLQNQLANREYFSPRSLIREFNNLHDQLLAALGKHKFAYIQQDLVRFFEQEKLFGELVFAKFPDVQEEIKDAGNCFAVGLHTACIFHLMRVSEHGMRHLARHLRVSLKDNKKPLPIEYATWDKVITGIKNKLGRVNTISI